MGAREDLMRRLTAEADGCYSWSNGPGYRYRAHTHPYEKVLYCVDGSITFVLEDTGRERRLGPGDRLVVPPGTSHSALVGERGVTCIEGRGKGAGRGVN